MTKLQLGEKSINFSQEKFSELERIKENKIGEISSYEIDSNKGVARTRLDISDSFSDIKKIDEYSLYYAFSSCIELTGSIDFQELISIGKSGLSRTFDGCTGLIGSVSFPKLTTIGDYGLSGTFYGCTGLTSISFPKLTSIGTYGLNSIFDGCTGLTSISFPELTSVGNYGLNYAFNRCTRLTGSISFPKLTSVGDISYAFYGCTGITEIHFRADIQSAIEAQTGYSSKFGATNATIYFDL
nr:MAG TPA: leucine-rich repeat protein [Caudoviricetes sp.]